MMVVYHHIKIQIPDFEPYLAGRFGASGVDIFFVISGFIMYITTANTANTAISPGKFMMRRIIRVVPLYWLLTCLMCLMWFIAPRLFNSLIVTPITFVQSLLFVPHYSLTTPERIFPLLVPGWTLNFEMFFYAIFASTLFLPRIFLYSAVSLLILALVFFGMVFGPFDSAMLTTYTSSLLLEFAGGVLIGKLWLHHRRGLGMMAGVAIFVSGWMLLIGNSVYSISHYFDIVGAILIVGGALNTVFLQWKNHGLEVLGDATYAIYLSHIFTLGVYRVFWRRFFDTEGSSINAIAFAASSMVMCLLVGILVYLYLEKPLTRFLNRRYFDRLNQTIDSRP